MDKRLLCFGYGYSARALAARLVPEGWHIVGTTRSTQNFDRIAATGVEPLLWPGTDPRTLVQEFPNVLISAAPEAGRDPVLDVLRDAFQAAAPKMRWVGYLSTTGVYGDHQGNWVDERSPLNAQMERSRARIRAEADWLGLSDLPLHIFRLAGIYGPGRGPFEKLRRGTARRIIKPGQLFGRIHVDDIAAALELSLEAPAGPAIFNLTDDVPAPPQDVIAFAASLLGLPVPPEEPFEDAALSGMARSFYNDNKRVRNDHAKRTLGWKLIHPDYRSGLAANLALAER
ncbi:SDR family oxidoreductase [uncultured Sulfitobacter sp.]|uniref:SDR family oxidoreductase n=1 Tax=uncultured Sulfitobacter sp. TaxID=191468 RepID=UPI002635AB8E|nr:SDR family oxidoreductase [uncultured Sulfitobacter sp.]